MNRILVLITLAENGIAQIKATPELPKREMEFVNRWKEEGLLESFFIATSKKDAILIFKNVDEQKAKSLIETLPYFPYMHKIDYYILDKQF
ncbi:hypothetical protein [Spirosoma foliorum]|uniref:Muconolactone isomerase domain-containing protein n=1 Tax=Spirosoma foliorum TaxID=2710596 RepID=A0A7G5H3W2_9BACT|nr:hypothetical protein [Spirosoma foliorum]QMW05804.1 hypothetical protein H3H32_13365 [Spirosoma foliorum]